METVVEKVQANLKLRIDEMSAELKGGKLPLIFADENRMIQTDQNLIDGMHIFSVQDNGISIEPQYSEKIFLIYKQLMQIKYQTLLVNVGFRYAQYLKIILFFAILKNTTISI